MKIKNAEFTISAVKESQYPKDDLKQVVLVGEMENTKFYQILLNFTIQFGHQLGHLKI